MAADGITAILGGFEALIGKARLPVLGLSFVVLFAPDSWVAKLKLTGPREQYGMYAGAAFVLSLVACLAWVGARVWEWWQKGAPERKRKKELAAQKEKLKSILAKLPRLEVDCFWEVQIGRTSELSHRTDSRARIDAMDRLWQLGILDIRQVLHGTMVSIHDAYVDAAEALHEDERKNEVATILAPRASQPPKSTRRPKDNRAA